MPDNTESLGTLSDVDLNGHLFKINDPDPNAAAVIGATSFSESSPTLAITTDGARAKKKIVSYMSLEQKSPVAGGPIEVLIFIGTVNRYSTGGNKNNQIQLKNPFLAGKFTPDFDFSINKVLEVAQSPNLTLVDRATFPAAVGSTVEFDCDEDWQFSDGAPGSLLIWVISATTGLAFKHHIEVVQS